VKIPRAGSMCTVFFSRETVTDYETASRADTKRYARFFHHLLSHRVYFPPSQFEATFVSSAHTHADILATVKAAEAAFSSLQ
jgi:glutamate-1-semialdehyde 2,1-aminomutase